MKITEDGRKYAAEQGIAEEEALKKGIGGNVPRVRGEGKRALREGVKRLHRRLVRTRETLAFKAAALLLVLTP